MSHSSYDNTFRIWDTTTGGLQAKLKDRNISHVHHIAFSQDGSRIVFGSHGGTISIWNARMGYEQINLIGHTDSVLFATFSKDGSQVVSTSADCTVRIWNAMTGQAEAELKGHTRRVTSAAFSQDGSTVVSASDDKTVRIWEVRTGKCQLMAIEDTTLSLPDGSVVCRAGIKGFHIMHPGQEPALRISDDRQWVMGPHHDCWIPAHYWDFTSSAFLGNRICLVYKTGRVVIFDMTSMVAEQS